MCDKKVLELIDYLYGNNISLNEPKYKRQQQMIAYACSIYGNYGEHLQSDLERLLKGYSISNVTDWNYDNCFRFKVFLHPGDPYTIGGKAETIKLVEKLGGTVYFLLIEISALGPYYECYFSQRLCDNSTRELITQVSEHPFSINQKTILKKVVEYCKGKGFKKLNKELLDSIVPGLSLDLAKEGEVTVYNCLFADTYH